MPENPDIIDINREQKPAEINSFLDDLNAMPDPAGSHEVFNAPASVEVQPYERMASVTPLRPTAPYERPAPVTATAEVAATPRTIESMTNIEMQSSFGSCGVAVEQLRTRYRTDNLQLGEAA